MDCLQFEKSKYEKAWNIPDYRKYSPGLQYAELFVEIAQPKSTDRLIDLGCGSGKASEELSKYCDVYPMDFVDNCLDDNHPLKDKYISGCLWHDIPKTYDIGYCTDVMEHIPTEYVMLVLKNISKSCDRCFFTICPHPDHFGKVVGHSLHLTVKPFKWWLSKLNEVGTVVQGRDFLQDCIYLVEFNHDCL